ncbi:LANO_0H02674g1_1 [Lachancea nothofagi CBS 11611]|uniref:RNA helicase n=1 Tax=Lachancea nothofagi CBS 11611 TaxID=1266666 RepID=A0A1G4KL67_9SACH|nr:LANO_0H02674g1_1 [Lachancea nothofagi CBS 11611]
MGTYRKRFNEKARAGQMAKLKDLKKVRNKQFLRHTDDGTETQEQSEDGDVHNTNAEIMEPLTDAEKQLKKRKLEELFKPQESKVSRLKRKRLDKFIEHQLKREEKKVLIEKLQEHKIDTGILTSSKNLGHGRQTKKQEFQEALKLERLGQSNELVRDILYREHEVKDWDEDNPAEANGHKEENYSKSDTNSEQIPSSSFVDNRPAKFGGSGFGFGFQNATVVRKTKAPSKKRYNWRERVQMADARKYSKEDEMDFESSGSEDVSESESESKSENESESESEGEGEGEGEIEVEGQIEAPSGSIGKLSDDKVDDSLLEESDYSSSSNPEEGPSSSKAASDFKTWAEEEIKRLEGRETPVEMPQLNTPYEKLVRVEDLDDGLQDDSAPIDEKSLRKAFYVNVSRPEEIQQARIKLPVYGEEHKIMEAIHHNDVVVICGETGSGKTTQVPQFLFEAGYGDSSSSDTPGMIGITQPRRVAAVSMAKRVSKELGNYHDTVSYQIRFDSTVSENTKMKFMTDGVLLREMMNDFMLTKYSSIIIDEAHERNINTDILIGLLSRCVRLRAKNHSKNPDQTKKLKLIIMSATLRVSDFSENLSLFVSPPPVLKVDARQYPVSIHFNKRTAFNYSEEAFRKTCKIHQKLPKGAILIFMTGQQEITDMVNKLRKEFPFPKASKSFKEMGTSNPTIKVNPKNVDIEAEDVDFSVNVMKDEVNDDAIDDYEQQESEAEEGFDEELEDDQTATDPLYVLPLYSLLPTKDQLKVFQEPPKGSRLCVVATNVAETSLTIPNIRYVVDCGRSKERVFNESNGVQSFEVNWISKASADQRSGRAGRTGPGHCYRLYSSAVYENDFQQFSKPEILRMPVESVVLQMKSMAIHNILNFPFPTPPSHGSLSKAVSLLQYLGALDQKQVITDDGRKMNLFPLSPRFSKMLLVGNESGCLPYVISIVSALSVGDPFLSENELGIAAKPDVDEEEAKQDKDQIARNQQLRTRYYKSQAKFSKLDKFSDVFKLLTAVSSLDYIKPEERPRFMEANFMRPKIVEEIRKLRCQLLYIVKSNTSRENVAVNVSEDDLKSGIPNENQVKLLKQMVCAGFVDQVAIRADQIAPEDCKITSRATISGIPYIPVLAPIVPGEVSQNFVYLHTTSIINDIGQEPPKYLVFHSLHLNKRTENSKTRIKPMCDIKSTPLANIARKGSLLTYSKPLMGNGIRPIDLSTTERLCYVTPRFGATVDSDLKVGWDLNPLAVHQKKVIGQWTVDKLITAKNYKTASAQNVHK